VTFDDDIRSVLTVNVIPSKGFNTAFAAAESIGSKPIVGYTYVGDGDGDGSPFEQSSEGPEKLWDGFAVSKYCVGKDEENPEEELRYCSIAKIEGDGYTVDGVILATANDSMQFGRLPHNWTVSGSKDGETWTEILSGTDEFFDRPPLNQKFYAGKLDKPVGPFAYFKFEGVGADGDAFQLSECVLTSVDSDAKEPVEYQLAEPYVDMEYGERREYIPELVDAGDVKIDESFTPIIPAY